MELTDFKNRGWVKFKAEKSMLQWQKYVQPIAEEISFDPKQKREWLRHGNTWFAGVNIFKNDKDGRFNGGPKLEGAVVQFLTGLHGPLALDHGQLSIIYPGYPIFDGSESEAAHRYRSDRDGAHVDGLLPIGPDRRRFVHEPHQYVLGIPLVEASSDASPMVIWEGSHNIIREAFRCAFKDKPMSDWLKIDVTETYHKARKLCFEKCCRVAIPAQLGESYVIHRLALHGMSPWNKKAKAPDCGRMIAYFRPKGRDGDLGDWLNGY